MRRKRIAGFLRGWSYRGFARLARRLLPIGCAIALVAVVALGLASRDTQFNFGCEPFRALVLVSHGRLWLLQPVSHIPCVQVIPRGRGFYLLWPPITHGFPPCRWIIPFWVPAVLLLPGLAALIPWRRRRRTVGHCTQCEYDLTGNVSGVCPECGAPVRRSARAE